MTKKLSLLLAALLLIPAIGEATDQLPDLADPAVQARAPDNAIKGPTADLEEARKVRAALDALIRAYESGDTGFLRSRISPSMIGYQRFIDGVTRDAHLMKQVRIHLFDTQVMAAPDMAVIQTGWEKRYLPLTAMTTPELLSGRGMFLLHRDQGEWKLAAMAGDNLFASQSGVMGQIQVSPSVIPAGSSMASVSLVDPDIAGLGSVTLEVISSQGERETLTLSETTPGRFVNALVDFDIAGGFVAGNGVLEGTAGVSILFTFRYLDRNPGGNRPPSLVVKQLRAGP